MKKSGRFFTIIVTAALALFMTACSGSGAKGTAPFDVTSYSQNAGPDGGTITDPRGAVIIIPAGALDSETSITVKTYEDNAALVKKLGINPCIGGVDFGPDGLVFKKPVTIEIPASAALVPGQEYPLYVYDESEKVWQETEFFGVASADGTRLIAKITHFSFYVAIAVPMWTLEKFKSFYSWGFVETALDNYQDWFLANTDYYGYTIQNDDKNYSICGMIFNVDVVKGADTETAINPYGETTTNIRTYTIANLADDYMDSSGNENIIDLLVTFYWKETEADPSDKLRMGLVEPVDGSTVSGMVTVGGFAKKAVKAEFYINGTLVETDTEAPFAIEWVTDSGSYPDGNYTIYARVYDSENKTADSESVTVTVANDTNPGGSEFADKDYHKGKAGGDLLITKAANETGFDSYVLYWGDINKNRLSKIEEISRTGSDIIYTISDDTEIPSGTKTLLLFTKSSSGETDTGISIPFTDLWEDRVLNYDSTETYTGCSATVYNEYGTETELRTYNTSGIRQGYTLYGHDVFGNLVRKERYNSSGTLTIYWVYEYFNNIPSLLIKDGLYNADGSIKQEYTRNYDTSHNLLFEKYIYTADTSQSYRDIYTYDAAGRVVTVYNYDGSEAETGHTVYVYSADGAYTCEGWADGYLKTRTVFDGTSAVTITYDAGGLYIGESVSNYSGSLLTSADVYTVDNHEKVVVEVGGEDTELRTHYEYSYNNNRLMKSTVKDIIYREYTDSEGNVTSWAWIWCTVSDSASTYNSSGIQTSYYWYSYDNDNVMTDGYSYTYDDAGRMTSCTEYGADGVVTKSETWSYQFYSDGRVQQKDYYLNSAFSSRSIYQYGNM